MPETSSLTADPSETIRSEPRLQKSTPLPTLSVDLRRPMNVAAEPGADLEVRGVIGEGGMGRVLLARQHSLSRDVAVKTVKADANESARLAILAEGSITGQLEHPSIVPVHALGLDTAGWPALVMKRVEGVSWDVLLEDTSHPGWEGWEGDAAMRMPGHLQILDSVCNALHFAHSRGIVHRDVKPQNVLIGRFGDVYLADWGVAGELGAAVNGVCGTPAYLAPEMANGGVIDARTDVYLLGATLHQVLTGKLRHPGATITESIEHARTSPPFTYGPEVPVDLAALANQACDPDPDRRPQSARAFRDALKLSVRHRAAVALGDQAEARLRELEALRAHSAQDPARLARIERLLAEARFGLEQSLAQWPENAPARNALARVEAIVAERNRHTLLLEAESRERDPRRGGRWRTVGLFGMTAMSGGVSLYANLSTATPTTGQLVFFPVLLLSLIGAGAWLGRHQFLSTRFNRQAFGGALIGLGGVVLERSMGFFTPVSLSEHFTRDSFLLATTAAMIGVAFMRWAWFLAAVYFVNGVVCSLVPALALGVFSWSTVVALSLGTWVSWRENR